MNIEQLLSYDIAIIIDRIELYTRLNKEYEKALCCYCLYIILTRKYMEINISNTITNITNELNILFGNDKYITDTFNIYWMGNLSTHGNNINKTMENIYRNNKYDSYLIIHCMNQTANNEIDDYEQIFRSGLESSLCAYGRGDIVEKIYDKDRCIYRVDYLIINICMSQDVNYLDRFMKLHGDIDISDSNMTKLVHILCRYGKIQMIIYLIDYIKLIQINDKINDMLVNAIYFDNIDMVRYFGDKTDINHKYIYKPSKYMCNNCVIRFPKDSKGYYYFTLRNLARARKSKKCMQYFDELLGRSILVD